MNALVACIAASVPDAVLPPSTTNIHLVWLSWEAQPEVTNPC